MIGALRTRAAIAALALLLLPPAAGAVAAAEPQARDLVLGSADGLGAASLARALAGALDGEALPATAVRATKLDDSVRLVAALRGGRVDLALVRADALAQAAAGRGAFAGAAAAGELRSIAHLVRLPLHLVVPADTAAAGPADLAGRPVAVAPPGAVRLGLVAAVLADSAAGASQPDLQPARLQEALDGLAGGRYAALAVLAGAPVAGLTAPLRRGEVRLLPIPGPAVRRLARRLPGVGPADVPGAPYGLTADTPGLGVGLVLAVRADLDAASAYRVTAALWSPAVAGQRAGHAPGRRGRLRLGQALSDLPVPLHAGAISWYQRRGLLP